MDDARRDFIRKAAVGAGAVWVAPVIQATAVHAQTGTPRPTTTTPTTVPDPCRFGSVPIDATQEVPANAGAGVGTGLVGFDASTLELCAGFDFSVLTSNAILAHIHGPAPRGVNAGILFMFDDLPNATSGTVPEQCFTLTEELRDHLCNGQLYINIHTQNFPAGEIRGQIEPI